jgi:hypothetical protein
MLIEVTVEQLAALRRALDARARDMRTRLASEPGDEGFRREAALCTQLLRQVEGLERQVRHARTAVYEDDETEARRGEN